MQAVATFAAVCTPREVWMAINHMSFGMRLGLETHMELGNPEPGGISQTLIQLQQALKTESLFVLQLASRF